MEDGNGGSTDIHIKIGLKTALWILLALLIASLIALGVIGYKYHIAKKKLDLIEHSDNPLSPELIQRKAEIDSLLAVNDEIESELIRKNKYIAKLIADEANAVADYYSLSPAEKDSTLSSNLKGK